MTFFNFHIFTELYTQSETKNISNTDNKNQSKHIFLFQDSVASLEPKAKN
jgi:hypothetical protein